MYDEMRKWLILGRKLNDIVRSLNDDGFDVASDVAIAVPSLTGYDLYDVYNPCKARGGSLNVTALGYWTEKSGVSIKLQQSKYERRANLHGMKVRVGILVNIDCRTCVIRVIRCVTCWPSIPSYSYRENFTISRRKMLFWIRR